MLPRNPYSEPSLPSCSGLHLSIRLRSKARPAVRDSAFKHHVFGVKTRNRGTPLTAPIVGSRQKTSSASVRTADAGFLCLEENRYQTILGASLLLMQGKGAPSLAAHPRKRRFPQTRKSSAAVEILCWNFCGVTNYKAMSLKFRVLSIHVTSEAFVSSRKISVMAISRQKRL